MLCGVTFASGRIHDDFVANVYFSAIASKFSILQKYYIFTKFHKTPMKWVFFEWITAAARLLLPSSHSLRVETLELLLDAGEEDACGFVDGVVER